MTNVHAPEIGIGRRVRQAREDREMSSAGLAAMVGMSPELLTAIEDGADLSTLQLNSIARATGHDVDYFLFPEDEVQVVLLREGEATSADTQAAVQILSRFVRDYEFLLSLGE